MKFSIQLSADYPDKAYGGDRVYQDMLSQAVLADRLGFDSVTIDESLAVLRALLNEEEVSWDGKYYKFDPITVPAMRLSFATRWRPSIVARKSWVIPATRH